MTEENQTVVETSTPDLSNLAEWTNEQCSEFDTKNFIPSEKVRDLLIERNTIAQRESEIFNSFTQLRTILAMGEMLGYVVKCPKCGIEYRVSPQDLNYNVEITCQDCGEKYIQNQNILGIYLRENNNATQE